MTDDELRAMWCKAGGRFHGPNIETGCMPESSLLPFLRGLTAQPNTNRDALWAAVQEHCDRETCRAISASARLLQARGARSSKEKQQ